MRGIILAGGSGTRLSPVTTAVSKQLLPVYDKPMIYYPLSVLMQAGIRDILVISNPQYLNSYRHLLGDGKQFGLRLHYAAQPQPRGLADALIIGADFVGTDQVALILGDNIFYSPGLSEMLHAERERLDGCTLFGYHVPDPERYGIAELDDQGNIVALTEKPEHPTSSLAVTGLYFYGNEVLARARELKPSARGELEITDLNRTFVVTGNVRLIPLSEGSVWFDTGTHESLLTAAVFVRSQHRRGRPLAQLETIARQMALIG
jgi:glucose-1-phosphate thymidylyltransferase